MSSLDAQDLDGLLAAHKAGVPGAWEKLSGSVYEYMRDMARRRLTREFGPALPGLTFSPTDIAHEAFIRLLRQRKTYDNSGQFFAIVATQMMRVLLDYYRRRKPGGRLETGVDVAAGADDSGVDVEALDHALQRLRHFDVRKADIVFYRYFMDFTIDQTAEALDVTHATVERDWAFAKSWLADELRGAA